jgi:antitoxin (DNA-binding transcriptional repressor) of toxin-antitoxin stability system
MREIGVGELKQSLSKTLHAVGRGEKVRVTILGRPVADIVPVGASARDDRLRKLVAEGRLTPPARARPRRSPRPATTRHSASSLVLSERDAERSCSPPGIAAST